MVDPNIKRNIVKIGMFAALLWVGYKVVTGLTKNKSPSKIIKETTEPIEKVAEIVKKTTKKFLKGSPEAKAHMANLRSKNKTPRGKGKRALRTKAKKEAALIKELKTPLKSEVKKSKKLIKSFQKQGLTGWKDKKDTKKAAGKKGGEATAKLSSHKGHKTKRGLSQDQKKVSKEKHEKNYQKSKKKK